MARRTSMGGLAMGISILFAAGALAACGDEGTADGGGTTGGSTTGASTTGGTTGGSTTGGGTTGSATTGGGSSTGGGFLTVNGCAATDYTDDTAVGSPTVEFPGTAAGQFHFVPNCILIHANQSVTFNGAFANHPLNPGVAPSATGSDPSSTPNPITLTNTGTSATFTFSTAGTYGMYCGFHQSLGMYGAIQVQ